MTTFDLMDVEQRAYVIQQFQTLLETVKEQNFRDRLIDMGAMVEIGGTPIETTEQKFLELALNCFGAPYSHEARE